MPAAGQLLPVAAAQLHLGDRIYARIEGVSGPLWVADMVRLAEDLATLAFEAPSGAEQYLDVGGSLGAVRRACCG